MRLRALEQGQSLVVQGPGLQHKHRHLELQAVDQVRDHHIFGPQTGGLRDGRKLGRSALQQGLCFEQFGGKVGAGFGV